jgi:5-methylthioadenosine/S-adenosylhomocysteine deaminase
VEMMTCNPGDELARSWGRQIGRLQPGAIADVVVLDTKARAEPFSAIVTAIETQVQLVVVAGKPLYGTAALMSAAGATGTTAITVGGQHRRLALTRPVAQGSSPEGTPWAWSSVTARINAVRKDPAGAVRAAQSAMAPWGGRLDEDDAPLRLALDMPTGLAPVGGLPKDLGSIVIPPLPSLVHDAAWLRAVAANPFHGGVLDALADYYT